MSAAEPTSRIRVMIVDDHPVVRRGIAGFISDAPDIEVVAEAKDGEEAMALFREVKPDVSLVDLRLPKIGGAELIARLGAEFPGARFLVLTTFDGDADIHRALAAGASGYLLKDMACDRIVDFIRRVHAGESLVSPALRARLGGGGGRAQLTDREHEVLREVARGNSNKIIADLLGISESTVRAHLMQIFRKLGVDDRTAAVTVALQKGWLELG
jgi:DNA-binding NarL/FixJ family response regulator